MHGGWCWQMVADQLRSHGHRVVTPTLTGQGERKHLLTRETSVDMHIQDLVNVVEFEDLDDIVFVFHSYSGQLAGPVVQRLVGRVRSVVFAGAFHVFPGECNFDVEPEDSRQMFEHLAQEYGDGWRIPVQDGLLERWGVTDPVLADRLRAKLTDFSLNFSRGVVNYDPQFLLSLPRTYIEHASPPLPALELSRDRAIAQGWTMVKIDTGHDMMLTEPGETTRLLLAIGHVDGLGGSV